MTGAVDGVSGDTVDLHRITVGTGQAGNLVVTLMYDADFSDQGIVALTDDSGPIQFTPPLSGQGTFEFDPIVVTEGTEIFVLLQSGGEMSYEIQTGINP